MSQDKYQKAKGWGPEIYTVFSSSENLRDGKVVWDAYVADGTSDFNRAQFILDFNDPRYVACLKKAKELKEKYPVAALNIATDRQKVVEYERRITQELLEVIKTQYGQINGAGSDDPFHPSLHDDWNRRVTDDPARSSEFKRDELVCRHVAPLMGRLLDEAGVPTVQLVGSLRQRYRAYDNEVESAVPVPATHMYLVSRLTNNGIDAIENPEFVYKVLLNGLSLDEIIAGKTAVMADYEGQLTSYGFGYVDTPEQKEILAKRLEKIRNGQFDDLPAAPKEARASVEDIKSYNKTIIEKYYRGDTEAEGLKNMKDLIKDFHKAVKNKDAKAISESLNKFPISWGGLRDALLLEIVPDSKLKNIPIVELLRKEGAGKTFLTPEDAVGILDHVDWHKVEGPDFAKRLVNQFNISTDVLLEKAVETGNPKQVDIVLDRLRDEPKTRQLEQRIKDKENESRKKDHIEAADKFAEFLKQNFAGIPAGALLGGGAVALIGAAINMLTNGSLLNMVGWLVGGVLTGGIVVGVMNRMEVAKEKEEADKSKGHTKEKSEGQSTNKDATDTEPSKAESSPAPEGSKPVSLLLKGANTPKNMIDSQALERANAVINTMGKRDAVPAGDASFAAVDPSLNLAKPRTVPTEKPAANQGMTRGSSPGNG